MAQSKVREVIARAFHEAETLCDSYAGWGGSDRLLSAVRIAAEQERRHRASGRAMVGNIGAREPVIVAAEYFALRGLLTPKRKRSFAARADFLAAYGAATLVEEHHADKMKAFRAKWGRAINAIDYSRDMVRS